MILLLTTTTDCEHQHIKLQQQRCVCDALPVSVCRAEEGQAASSATEGEDLGSILAEGVAKALLHTHLWSAVPDRCLQVSRAEALQALSSIALGVPRGLLTRGACIAVVMVYTLYSLLHSR